MVQGAAAAAATAGKAIGHAVVAAAGSAQVPLKSAHRSISKPETQAPAAVVSEASALARAVSKASTIAPTLPAARAPPSLTARLSADSKSQRRRLLQTYIGCYEFNGTDGLPLMSQITLTPLSTASCGATAQALGHSYFSVVSEGRRKAAWELKRRRLAVDRSGNR